jgi:hypothetical protein
VTRLRKPGSSHLTLVPPVIVAAPARIVPRNDIVHAHACVHCHQPCDGQFNLGGDRWHWACWKQANPRPKQAISNYHIDTTWLRDDPSDGTEEGWYAIIRTNLGRDLWCGPYDSETLAMKMAQKEAKALL